MLMRDLYTSIYDSEPTLDEPRKTIMLATIPRSGSTHFGLCMWAEGVFGAPLEYLNANTSARMLARLGRGDRHRYWQQLRRLRQGKNGVFSYKMFVVNYVQFKKKAPDFLPYIAPNYVVYLTRDDKLGQAVSYARAVQTRRWFAAVAEQRTPEYSFEKIRRQLRSIMLQERSWESIFALTETSPLRVSYERVLLQRDEVMRELAAYVGETIGSHPRIEVGSIEKQADLMSEDWRNRYLEDAVRRGVPALDPLEPAGAHE